ncbi:MAG: hypothetical protein KDA60_03445 [Planctomycetales bacterium]|nr:hypothetical protein [Planctomycetales bacterium]
MSRELFDGFGIESLENRRMMAGDVSVDVTGGGDLRIDGDNASNEIVIRGTDVQGRFEIRGKQGTLVNGQQSIVVDGVTDDVRINLRNGDNRLEIEAGPQESDVTINDDLQIRTGNGSDVILLDEVRVLGTASINTGGGDDGFLGSEIRINGDFRWNSGSGDDVLLMDRMTIRGRMRANMGSGDDVAFLYDSEFFDGVQLSLGSGDDILGVAVSHARADVAVNGGGGTDIILTDSNEIDGEYRLRSVEDGSEVPNLDIFDLFV